MFDQPLSRVLLLSAALALRLFAGVDYTRDVQPIFAESCYGCHGPKQQMGGLRLDASDTAARALKPGKPDESPLYLRITGANPDQPRMPMGGKPLAPEKLAVIKQWITEQTPVVKPPHWAFQPPQRPALPSVQNAKWSKTPVDRFILARLEQEQLAPSAEADRVTLLRRLSLDLTGLPPTIAEVDAFLKDKSANAYEKQVDRLLASPHYGERWGRHWLDAARYADSDGYEKDKQRWVWFYRDYVIRSLNKDLPYNQFIIEQVAGDLLPNATQDQKVATGFLRNSMINEEGGIDPEQFRMEAMFDRIEAIGKGVLGVTIQCAQCHNHKFDPLTQEEYYRLFAFLNDTHEANIPVYTAEEQQKRAEIFRRTRELEADLQHRHPDWEAQMAAWERTVTQNQPNWTIVKPVVDENTAGGEKYLAQPDGSMLAQGYAPTKHRAKLTIKTDAPRITTLRLELLNSPDLPFNGPGRSYKGTGALTEFEVEAASASDPEKFTKVKIARATADVNPPERPLEPIFDDKSKKNRVTGPIDFAIDGKEETAWSFDDGPAFRNQPHQAVFTLETPIENAGSGIILRVFLSQKHGGWNSDDNQNHNLGRVRLAITDTPDAAVDPVPAVVREALAIPLAQRTPAQTETIFRYWRTTVPAWHDANETIAALWSTYPEGTPQLVLAARQQENHRETHLLTRGDFLKPAQTVAPGVPSFLNPLPANAPANRLTFAQWLVDRKAPTTARAMVNRVWQTYFGTGLVATSEDLGRQSETPSHPELLDWLAVEFMDHGWSLKHLHRTIVTSAVYRQASRVTPELYAKDPYNRLLARGPRFRVEAEIIRDITLSASGLLNEKVGGPSVYPPAPEFLFQPPVSYGPKVWREEHGPDRYRRALYTFRYRSVPYPMLQTFDAPNGDVSCVRRNRSNTPLQALTSLNEPLFLEAARALAQRTLHEGGKNDEARLTYAFRRCVARPPNATERTALLGLLNKETARFADGEHNPWDLAADDPAHPPTLNKSQTPAQLAAWTAVSRVLLNLDETITKE